MPTLLATKLQVVGYVADVSAPIPPKKDLTSGAQTPTKRDSTLPGCTVRVRLPSTAVGADQVGLGVVTLAFCEYTILEPKEPGSCWHLSQPRQLLPPLCTV